MYPYGEAHKDVKMLPGQRHMEMLKLRRPINLFRAEELVYNLSVSLITTYFSLCALLRRQP